MKHRDVCCIALAGNPNVGKTTVFNELVGGKQKIGNWPGVTVEKKEGLLEENNKNYKIVDLPGIYSFSAHAEDEKVARDYVLSGEVDLVVNILDATNLERNLYLTAQLVEMKVPVIVVLNKMDMAKKQHLKIDIKHLQEHLGCPVIELTAIKKGSIEVLKEGIKEFVESPDASIANIEYPEEIEDFISFAEPLIEDIALETGTHPRWVAVKILEDDPFVLSSIKKHKPDLHSELIERVVKVRETLGEDPDILIADYRYGFIRGIVREVIKKTAERKKITDLIDSFVLNRFLGLPVFFFIMYLVFWVTISVGGAFIDFFDIAFGAVFVDGFGALLGKAGAPEWITAILAGGVGAGIRTVATFVPIIFFMFLMLSFLEDSGYMARAAFVMDRFMRFIGLPGKSFVPMLLGFGCTVPAIMATRTLENRKDRIMTIFMSPFMSCGARLPVYVLFAAAFFPAASGLMVFSLYMTGLLLAVLTGLLLKYTILKGEASHFVMELPCYTAPRFKHIFIHTWNRLKQFMFRAGKVIVAVVMVLAFLNSLGTDGSFGNEDTDKSVLAKIGHSITPVFVPMGIERDNWPASVAIFTGIFAKEAVVGTLNSLYSQLDSVKDTDKNVTATEESAGEENFDLLSSLGEAVATIPENLSGIFGGLADPFGMSVLDEAGDEEKVSETLELESGAFASMKKYFSKGKYQAYAFLLFILIYFPCAAVLGAMAREIGLKLSVLVVGYLTVLGWLVSTMFYQVMIGHSAIWISVCLLVFAGMFCMLKIFARTELFRRISGVDFVSSDTKCIGCSCMGK